MKRMVVVLTFLFVPHPEMSAAADAATQVIPTVPQCTIKIDEPYGTPSVRPATSVSHEGTVDTQRAAERANQSRCLFRIPSTTLGKALKLYSRQALVEGAPVGHAIRSSARLRGFRTRPLEGIYGAAEAVGLMLKGSGFEAQFTEPNQVAISAKPVVSGDSAKIPEVTVESQRPLDASIPLIPGGLQPYFVIDRLEIERMGTNLKSVLDLITLVNGSHAARGQLNAIDIGQNRIDLRGLGTDDTQVLLNGRRIDVQWTSGTRGQGDVLRALPAAAVDRIEFHPPSASGIYGGGATAGVLNIVLKDECSGGRLAASYGNSFHADTLNRGLFVSDCHQLSGGRTVFSFFSSSSEEAALLAGDRDFLTRGRSEIQKNNPSFFNDSRVPPIGAQTNARSLDGTGLGGPGTPSHLSVPDGYRRDQGLAPLLNNPGYNLELADTSQPEGGARSVIRNGAQTRYFNGRLLQKLSDRLAAYADFSSAELEVQNESSIAPYARLTGLIIPANAPGNPFGKPISVSAPAMGGDGPLESRANSRKLFAGVRLQGPNLWNAKLELTHAVRKQRWSLAVGRSAAEAVLSGDLHLFSDLSRTVLPLASLMDTQYAPDLVSRARAVSLQMEGSLARLGSGNVMIRGLFERRKERFEGGMEYITQGTAGAVPMSLLTPRARSINSAYVDIRLPIGTPLVAQRGALARHAPELRDEGFSGLEGTSSQSTPVPRFEVQLAGRFDDYTTTTAPPRVEAGSTETIEWAKPRFQTINPTVAFHYRALPSIAVRASFGTGFVPPTGDQLASPAPRYFPAGVLRDPQRGNTASGPLLLQAGGNPELKPERSESWSAGLLFMPDSVGQLTASLDYVEIRKTNNIVSPADLAMTNFALFEERHPERVTRAPSIPGDPYGVGIITAIDASDINVAQAKVRAWDLDVRYLIELDSISKLSFLGHVTWQPELSSRATPKSPDENNIAVTANAPLRVGAVGGVTLARGHAKFSWITRYSGKYQVSRDAITLQNQGARKIGHQTYHDVAVTYEMPVRRFLLDDLELQATVQNVFDREPPFDAGNLNYFSPFADPRGAVYAISLTARF